MPPLILVTNDDGVTSDGLHAVASALAKLGTVWVVAPDRQRTAVGHALTLHKPLRLNRVAPRWFSVNGTPTDCVNLAVQHVLPRAPAVIVSGINQGVNIGDDVTYSGTVSAALEGAIMGIPSLAVSQDGGERFRFPVAADYAVMVAKAVLQYGLPPETLLNVNVPDRPRSAIRGLRITRLSRRRFDNPVIQKVDPRGRHYYWIAGTRMTWKRQADSDYRAMQERWVSVTPLHLDMTHEAILPELRNWKPFALAESARTGRSRHAESKRARS